MHRIIVSLTLGCVLSACAGSQQHFDATGFRSDENHYRVPFQEGTKSLLGPEWSVTNFRHDGAGNPTEILEGSEYTGDVNWTSVDGETTSLSVLVYDLLLSHRTNATIWLRVVPIPHELLNKHIKILAENYVNNLNGAAGTGYFGTDIHTRRVATKIIKSEPISLLGAHAHAVTFDLVDLNQLEMDENAPRTRIEIVLAQTNFVKELGGSQKYRVPGYLLVGYSNDAPVFDEHLATFRRFAMSIQRTPAD
jgi:hypothetical protein